MTPADIREEILDILENIAPDEDLSDLKEDVAFRDQLELDSMDFLDIVMELRKRYRIQIPEEDYLIIPGMNGYQFIEGDADFASDKEKAAAMLQNAVIFAAYHPKFNGRTPSMAFVEEGPYAIPMAVEK